MVPPPPAMPALRSESVKRELFVGALFLVRADSLTCLYYAQLAPCFLHLPRCPGTFLHQNSVLFLILCHCVGRLGHLSPGCSGCFYYFAVMNNATMNNLVPLPFHTCVGLFVG